MANFFRYEPDGISYFPMMLIRIVFVIVLLLAYRFSSRRRLLKTALLCSFSLQVLLFSWYAGNPALFLKEGLPLYHCRLSAVMMAAAFVLKKEKVMRFFAWMGLLGAIIAFSLPDPSPFLWPHVTNITYVGSHMMLGLSSVMIIKSKRSVLEFKDVCMYTVVMNVMLFFVNYFFGSNYGYLRMLPKSFTFTATPLQLFFAMTGLIAFLIFGMEMVYINVYRHMEKSFSEDMLL